MNIKKFIKRFIPWLDTDKKIFKLYKKSNRLYSKGMKAVSYLYFFYIYKRYNCHISPQSIIKSQINIPHPIGIVIGEGVKIGENVTLYQNVTLGRKYKNVVEYPEIGDNVIIYSNSAVLGNVKINNGAVVGCNSVVMRDVKEGEVVFGVVK